MSKEHTAIIIPGLGNDTKKIEFATNGWGKYGLNPLVQAIDWHIGNFEQKLELLLSLVDKLTNKGDIVSLIGTSAGGCAVVNVFFERRNRVHRVVNVCGRLRKGSQTGFRSYETMTASSPAFAESVVLCEARLNQFTLIDKAKIMTVRALFGDELVPADTTVIQGAYNTTVPMFEHALSIGAALSLFSEPIISFLNKEN